MPSTPYTPKPLLPADTSREDFDFEKKMDKEEKAAWLQCRDMQFHCKYTHRDQREFDQQIYDPIRVLRALETCHLSQQYFSKRNTQDTCEVTRKLTAAPAGIHRCQSMSAALRSSSWNVPAPKVSTRTRTRVAVRSHRLAA